MTLALVLTPHGSLILRREGDTMPELPHGARLEAAFGRGTGHGLLSLGADEVAAVLPPVLAPADAELSTMAAAAPLMTGAEYLTASLAADFRRLGEQVRAVDKAGADWPEAGADAIVAGSAIFGSDDHTAAITRIRDSARSSKEAAP